MNYRSFAPASDLAHIIQCVWTVDDDDAATVHAQKIIPDGYTELIFHFGEPYRIKLGKKWELQSKALVAGQIKKHFFLENTGVSRILGIKLKPSVLTHLFGINMSKLTDRVMDIRTLKEFDELAILHSELLTQAPDQHQIHIENFFRCRKGRVPKGHLADTAVDVIFSSHGMMTVKEVASRTGFTERHIEQLFKKFIGLTPKFLARIVRFSYIFQLITDNGPNWGDIVFRAGFYDQSHFIRNFKSFTGEDPSRYLFEKNDMANFFLKPSRVVAK